MLDFFWESAILVLCECEGGNSFAFQQTNVCVNPHESGVLRFYSKSLTIDGSLRVFLWLAVALTY